MTRQPNNGKRASDFALFAFLVAALFACGFLTGRRSVRNPPISPVNAKTDTFIVYRVDTAYLRPVCVREYVRDTMRVYVHDTTYISLPLEVKVYESDTARAVVSGYRPSLDTLVVYPRTEIRTIERVERVQPSPWSLSVQAGYGAGTQGLTPYVGVGVSYNLLTFGGKRANR